MSRSSWFVPAILVLGCAETQTPAPVAPPAHETPGPASGSTAAPSVAASPADASVPTPRDAAVPPLKTPNAPVATGRDAGEPPASPAPNEDPRTAAIRRVGQIAQGCQSKHASNVGGKLVLRLSLASDGRVSEAKVLRDATTQALLLEPFTRCVVEGARGVTFPTPRDEDTELEVPIQFAPGP